MAGEPTPLDLNGKDILDVGVGDGHVIVLTGDKKVYVIGEGGNGQLGLGQGMGTKSLEEWQEVNLKLEREREVVGVVAGPKCSFVVVRVVEL